MSDLWTAASIDTEQELRLRLVTTARVGVQSVWSFLASAEDEADFDNRQAMVAERIDAAVADATAVDPEQFVGVRDEVLASLREEYKILAAKRKVESFAAAEPDTRARVVAELARQAEAAVQPTVTGRADPFVREADRMKPGPERDQFRKEIYGDDYQENEHYKAGYEHGLKGAPYEGRGGPYGPGSPAEHYGRGYGHGEEERKRAAGTWHEGGRADPFASEADRSTEASFGGQHDKSNETTCCAHGVAMHNAKTGECNACSCKQLRRAQGSIHEARAKDHEHPGEGQWTEEDVRRHLHNVHRIKERGLYGVNLAGLNRRELNETHRRDHGNGLTGSRHTAKARCSYKNWGQRCVLAAGHEGDHCRGFYNTPYQGTNKECACGHPERHVASLRTQAVGEPHTILTVQPKPASGPGALDGFEFVCSCGEKQSTSLSAEQARLMGARHVNFMNRNRGTASLHTAAPTGPPWGVGDRVRIDGGFEDGLTGTIVGNEPLTDAEHREQTRNLGIDNPESIIGGTGDRPYRFRVKIDGGEHTIGGLGPERLSPVTSSAHTADRAPEGEYEKVKKFVDQNWDGQYTTNYVGQQPDGSRLWRTNLHGPGGPTVHTKVNADGTMADHTQRSAELHTHSYGDTDEVDPWTTTLTTNYHDPDDTRVPVTVHQGVGEYDELGRHMQNQINDMREKGITNKGQPATLPCQHCGADADFDKLYASFPSSYANYVCPNCKKETHYKPGYKGEDKKPDPDPGQGQMFGSRQVVAAQMCKHCGNPIEKRDDPTGQRGNAWAEVNAWGDDRDFQCGMNESRRHEPVNDPHGRPSVYSSISDAERVVIGAERSPATQRAQDAAIDRHRRLENERVRGEEREYADQHGHDVANMTAEERNAYDQRMRELDTLVHFHESTLGHESDAPHGAHDDSGKHGDGSPGGASAGGAPGGAPGQAPPDQAQQQAPGEGELQQGQQVTVHYVMPDGTKGDCPATVQTSDGQTATLTYENGTFSVTMQNGAWADSQGATFTFDTGGEDKPPDDEGGDKKPPFGKDSPAKPSGDSDKKEPPKKESSLHVADGPAAKFLRPSYELSHSDLTLHMRHHHGIGPHNQQRLWEYSHAELKRYHDGQHATGDVAVPHEHARKESSLHEAVNPLNRQEGSVGTGDEVLYADPEGGGRRARVTRVLVHPPGKAPKNAPIKPEYHTVEVQTDIGHTRWLGADHAEIGPDLRVHWKRGSIHQGAGGNPYLPGQNPYAVGTPPPAPSSSGQDLPTTDQTSNQPAPQVTQPVTTHPRAVPRGSQPAGAPENMNPGNGGMGTNTGGM